MNIKYILNIKQSFAHQLNNGIKKINIYWSIEFNIGEYRKICFINIIIQLQLYIGSFIYLYGLKSGDPRC